MLRCDKLRVVVNNASICRFPNGVTLPLMTGISERSGYQVQIWTFNYHKTGYCITEYNRVFKSKPRRFEISKYLEERTSTETSVSSDERIRTRPAINSRTNRNLLES